MTFPIGTVYCLRKGSKVYIGSTRKPLKHRVSQHLQLARRPTSKGHCASYDIVKGGLGSFEVQVLQQLQGCTTKELRQAEQQHFLNACWTPGLTVLNCNRPCASVYLARPTCAHQSLQYSLHGLEGGHLGLV